MRFISGVHHIPPHPYPLPKEREPVATHRVKAAKRSHGSWAEVRPLLGERVGVRGNAAHEYSIAHPLEMSRNHFVLICVKREGICESQGVHVLFFTLYVSRFMFHFNNPQFFIVLLKVSRFFALIGTRGNRYSSRIWPIIANAALMGTGFDSMKRSLNNE